LAALLVGEDHIQAMAAETDKRSRRKQTTGQRTEEQDE
jgi:hypothetical protein